MIFYSVSFLLFFCFFSLLVHFSPSVKAQNIVFLVANIVFYAYWDYRFLLLLFGVICICYFSTLWYSKTQKQWLISLSVIICLAILWVFKYFDFFATSFSRAFGISDHVTLGLILPLGISFYLFQAMSYLFDVRYGKVQAESDFIKVACSMSFFPQTTSGPIVKS